MIEVQEVENFWNETDWLRVKKKYYDPLIESNDITNFKYEIEPNDYYYRVRRTYWDMRPLRIERDNGGALTPGLELPPRIKVGYTVEMELDDAVEALEIIQDHERYWPGVDLKTYGVAGSDDGAVTACLILKNYDDEENEDEPAQGDIQYE